MPNSIVFTDIPQEVLPALVDLSLRVKKGNVRSVVFKNGVSGFTSVNPSFDQMRSRVKKAMADGLTVEQAKQQLALPEKYKSFAFQNFAHPNVEDMYKELAGTKF